jgi:hypothetical protein
MRSALLLMALVALGCSAADPNTPNDGVGETEGNTEVVETEVNRQPDKANTVVEDTGITFSGGTLVSHTAGRFDSSPVQADNFFAPRASATNYLDRHSTEVVVQNEKAEFLPQRVMELDAARKAMGGGR